MKAADRFSRDPVGVCAFNILPEIVAFPIGRDHDLPLLLPFMPANTITASRIHNVLAAGGDAKIFNSIV